MDPREEFLDLQTLLPMDQTVIPIKPGNPDPILVSAVSPDERLIVRTASGVVEDDANDFTASFLAAE